MVLIANHWTMGGLVGSLIIGYLIYIYLNYKDKKGLKENEMSEKRREGDKEV